MLFLVVVIITIQTDTREKFEGKNFAHHIKFLKSLGILLVFRESNAPSSLEAHNALLL